MHMYDILYLLGDCFMKVKLVYIRTHCISTGMPADLPCTYSHLTGGDFAQSENCQDDVVLIRPRMHLAPDTLTLKHIKQKRPGRN